VSARPGRGQHEAGFSLVELIVVVAILGVISSVLTEALILGLRTTDGTIANVSRAAGVQILEPYFTADAHSAEVVWTDPTPTCASGPAFVHLRWTESGSVVRTVGYGLDPAVGPDQELVRVSCVASGPPERKVLGHFTHDPAGPQPVSVACDAGPCPTVPGAAVATVTLLIQVDPSPAPPAPISLTVRRRLT
jgi:prepilin-type N-terminal cleavage/methylation domain-containing protein